MMKYVVCSDNNNNDDVIITIVDVFSTILFWGSTSAAARCHL